MLSVFFESSYSLLQGIVNMLLLIGVGTSVTCIRAFDEEVKYKVRIRKRGRKVHVRKPSDKERTLRKHGSTPACKAHSPSESGPSASSSSSTVRAKDLHPAYISDESYFRVSERMMKPYASSVPGIPRKFEIRPAQGFENGRFPPAAEKGNFAKTYGNCNYGYDYGRDYKQAKHYGGYERNKNTAENPYEFGYNYEENYEGGKQEKENKGYEHYDKTGGRTKEKIFETLQDLHEQNQLRHCPE
ncbi:hypothetical protein RB195_004295 [Necator americanus]|uniref:Uncharacterized protein n=1 Tax=Necator americanus TaxID=51031 RepID=A0ABR1BH96_NECAM